VVSKFFAVKLRTFTEAGTVKSEVLSGKSCVFMDSDIPNGNKMHTKSIKAFYSVFSAIRIHWVLNFLAFYCWNQLQLSNVPLDCFKELLFLLLRDVSASVSDEI